MSDRYKITLDDVPAHIVGIKQEGVPCGYLGRHIEAGYVLTNSTVVLESQKDAAGYYVGGAGMDGMYLATDERYEPVRNDEGKITALRLISPYVAHIPPDEQRVIYQQAINTKENLLEDLHELIQAAKNPQLRDLYARTYATVQRIPDAECRQLMGDIRAVYKARHMQTIIARLEAAQQSEKSPDKPHQTNKKRSAER